MRAQRPTLIAVLAAIWLMLFSAPGAFATEYAEAQRPYNWGNKLYPRQSAELKAAIEKECMRADYAVSCTFEYGAEVWYTSDSNFDKWKWLGTTVLKIQPPGRPEQVITTSGIFGQIYTLCPWDNWSTIINSTAPYCQRNDTAETDCEQCKRNTPAKAVPPSVGNPIFPSNRVKHEVRVDYENAKGTLRFVRTYRSDRNGWANNYQSSLLDLKVPRTPEDLPVGACYLERDPSTFGRHCYPYIAMGTTNDIALRRGGERARYFSSGAQFSPAADVKDRLTPQADSAGTQVGWQVRNGNSEALESYDLSGRLITSTALNGQVTTFTYSDASTPKEIAPKAGLLIRVTDAFASSLAFSYDAGGNLTTMTDPAGGTYAYAYDVNGNLSTVTYPDGKTITYLYNETGLTSPSMTNALTGIIDENNSRYATFTYIGTQALSTQHAARRRRRQVCG